MPIVARRLFHAGPTPLPCHKGGTVPQYPPVVMVRLENISKQHSNRLLFIEASASLLKGEKIGLVGPNGAGKTTLFRMITGEEESDERCASPWRVFC